MRSVACLAVLCLAIMAVGCDNNLWWEYRDDPYIANLAKKGEHEILRGLNSPNKDQRQMALRIIAAKAGEHRRQGNHVAAEALDDLILRRYVIEKEPVVRACIVRVCAPAVGRGSDAMVLFLRNRIAAGEFPGYAALSLASLAPKGAFTDIEPLTRHPSHDVRYQALIALCILADPQGYDPVNRAWQGMRQGLWPERVDGLSLDEAKSNLEMRARRGFGRPLH